MEKRMSRMVAFRATNEEEKEIEAYMKAKHLRSLPELSRTAFFAYMRQNRPGAHRSQNHAAEDEQMQPGAGGRYPPLVVAKSGGGK